MISFVVFRFSWWPLWKLFQGSVRHRIPFWLPFFVLFSLSPCLSFFFIYGSLIKSNTTLEAQGNRKRTAATDVVVSHRRSRQQVERPLEKKKDRNPRNTLTRSTSQNFRPFVSVGASRWTSQIHGFSVCCNEIRRHCLF